MGKIFGIGMFRTGTTSLGEAMKVLGFRSRIRFIPVDENEDLERYFDLDPRQFHPAAARIRREAEKYEFLCDSPWLYLYRELDDWYPGSLFILTLRRDVESLASSEARHWQAQQLLPRWLETHDRPPARQLFIDRYRRHNANVLAYFRHRPERLLTVCWETERDPWDRLCSFVGRPVPDVPFPHVNASLP